MTALIRLTLAWIAGIVLARQFSPPTTLLLAPAIPVVMGLLLWRKNPRARHGFALALAVLLGAGRLVLAQPRITPNHIAFYNDSGFYIITGQIAAEPDVRDTTTNYRIATESITPLNGTPRPVHGTLLVQAARFPAFEYGDTVRVFAAPETPPVFDDFSYRDFLAVRNIYSFARRPRLAKIAAPPPVSLWGAIFRLKHHAADTINRILSEPEASLLNGILLGIRGNIPQDLYEKFNATGTSHIIVISGSNISLVVMLFLLAGRYLVGRNRAIWLALAGVTLYTVMVGADAAVVRAAMMGGLYVLSMQLGRPNASRNTLFAAAWLMTVQNPLVLWDVGFQLSFMATLGLAALVPALKKVVPPWLATGFLGEGLLMTLAAQIATTPLILYQFGRLSLISLLANLLVVPVQPWVMFGGGAAMLGGMVSLLFGKLLGWVAWLPLAWTVRVVEWAAGIGGAQMALPQVSAGMVLGAYALIGWGAMRLNRRHQTAAWRARHAIPQPVWWASGIIALIIVALPVWHTLPDGNLHVAFLDIGQGDAVLITTPRGRQMLVDGGPSSVIALKQLGEKMPFWDNTLDVLVSTHPDSDHLTGLVAVARRFEVGTVLVSDIAGDSALAKEWQTTIAGTRVITAQAGMRLQLDNGVSVRVLNPGSASEAFPDKNNHSVTTMIEMGRVRFLLSGDLEAPGEAALLASGADVRAMVLKSPHHGSDTGSSATFLDAVQPQVVVISVGADNPFGHPTPAVLARYAARDIAILRTDERGTVELVTDGQALWLAR